MSDNAGRQFLAKRLLGVALCCVALFSAAEALAGGDTPTEFTNSGSIINTRHNMTQRSASGADLLAGGPHLGGAGQMDDLRNNYGEVCVYCHTPHAAATTTAAPLWNRLLPNPGSFTTYAALGSSTLTQPVTAPAGNSLICLSCHDGTFAIDSILNMPGSGKYSANPDEAFLDSWVGSELMEHRPFGDRESPNEFGTCLTCHSPGHKPSAIDFRVAVIGKDLGDDHPIGVTFPTGNADFNAPTATQGSARFFDLNGNNRMDKNEVRVYDSGGGHEVECASCHDPHGVPSGGAGSNFIPAFMRVANNNGSGLCLTCHVK